MPEANVASLVDYLRLNGQRFSLDALREHLLAQGYDPGLVDQAIAAYREPGAHPVPKGRSGWAVALGCLGGLVIGAASLVSLLFGLCGGFSANSDHPSPGFFVVAALLALLALGAALYPFFSKRRSK